jgi:transposase
MKTYDHYIAVDWAQTNMAIARMTASSSKIECINVASNLEELKNYLDRLRGKKILTFEETTTSQWLYVELRKHVDEILVCDPYRNHLLSDGPKTDEWDAKKLVELLRGGLLKGVYHSAEAFMDLRKFVSCYEDLVKSGVRLKNQRAALFRGQGQGKNQKRLSSFVETFALEGIDRGIKSYEEDKSRYEGQMEKFLGEHILLKHLKGIDGIGALGAIKIAARVVDAKRFKSKGQWLSYCGLVKHEKMSGGRSYGFRSPRYCRSLNSRSLKSVFKIAALSVLFTTSKNSFKSYYDYLIKEKSYPEHDARHAVARRIAVIALGVMKSGTAFNSQKIQKGVRTLERSCSSHI